jgi:hypothetical protein
VCASGIADNLFGDDSMKSCSGAARFSLTIMAVLVFANAAAAQHPVPFKGALKGTYTSTPVPPFPPRFVDVLLTASGQATQLGRFTLGFPARVDISNVPTVAAGTCTFTAANGDTILAEIIGEGTAVAPGLLRVVDKGKIVGGTGRFAGASGEFVMVRLLDQANFTTIGWFSGTVQRKRR